MGELAIGDGGRGVISAIGVVDDHEAALEARGGPDDDRRDGSMRFEGDCELLACLDDWSDGIVMVFSETRVESRPRLPFRVSVSGGNKDGGSVIRIVES